MATYRVVGKRFVMGTTVDQVSRNAEGQEVITRYAGPSVVYEVGAEVTDLPADILAAFPDRFVRVDVPEAPLPPVDAPLVSGVPAHTRLERRR